MQNEVLRRIEDNVAKVMIGKEEVTRLLLAAIAAGGHVLLEDVPGTGKTVLAKTLAKSMGCQFDRVQFTPDLLPTDVTGLSFFNQEKGCFTFKEGPVFTNILLADEINRATPRTQSSLLECMAEGQVTVDGVTRALSAPFFVIATQNPIETIGCFPLPEAQLDRFIMKLYMGSLDAQQEIQMLERFMDAQPLAQIEPECRRNCTASGRVLSCVCASRSDRIYGESGTGNKTKQYGGQSKRNTGTASGFSGICHGRRKRLCCAGGYQDSSSSGSGAQIDYRD